MSVTVCVVANTLRYPNGGGQMWVFLNWTLGLREIGCDVLWLEGRFGSSNSSTTRAVENLRRRLAPYGLDDRVAVWSCADGVAPQEVPVGCVRLEDAVSRADLVLNLCYDTPDSVLRQFRRSALIDIDPGLLQLWVSGHGLRLADHDVYFTTGETVGRPGSGIPDLGKRWLFTPPCVSLQQWSPVRSAPDAPFSTVTHWWSKDWLKSEDGGVSSNEKRTGFLPYLDLPRRTTHPLELAMQLRQEEHGDVPAFMAKEEGMLREHGWRVRDSWSVAGTPWDYQSYIRGSRCEFSCVKPSCVKLQNAWISDRTLCYLASGKPAVVQHTGASKILPDRCGIWRFRTPDEAASGLDEVSADYDTHSRAARNLAEECFDARKVAGQLLEQAL